MAEKTSFSPWLLKQPAARSEAALNRIEIAKRRVQSVLDTHIVAHTRTLEQKISDQGPRNQRVDPHLLGLAIRDLRELNRLQALVHPATGRQNWFANPATRSEKFSPRLDELAPLYASVSGHGFGNLVGDSLELVVFKTLDTIASETPRYSYAGQFDLGASKKNGRYIKSAPPKAIGGRSTLKEADFFQFGHEAGALCIECKNLREWLYPNATEVSDLIIKASDLGLIPVLVARRLQYTTKVHLLEPGGIIFYESLFQYYPSDQADLAATVRNRNSLGFSDVLETEEPHEAMVEFFRSTLPRLVAASAPKWRANETVLREFALRRMPLKDLYAAINSPGVGQTFDDLG